MRVLIVGAGIAGLAAAACLGRRGIRADVVERASSSDGGYVLGLYPLADRIFRELGIDAEIEARSEAIATYDVVDLAGRPLRAFDLRALSERLGPMRGISRAALIAALRGAAGGVTLRTAVSVERLEDGADGVSVRTTDGVSGRYDLVIGSDGTRSDVRSRLALAEGGFDTGWACWTWWAPRRSLAAGTVLECWGAGRLLGFYPSPVGVGVVACAPAGVLGPNRAEGRAARLRSLFPQLRGCAADLFADGPDDSDGEVYHWRLDDRTAKPWSRGRVALCGDAACGFLPTAGIGASMALESAFVLAEEVARGGPEGLAEALTRYEARRRPRCEAALRDSRRLARLMFLQSPLLVGLRGLALRVLRPQDLVGNIVRMAERPL